MLAHADLAAFKVIGIVLEIYEHCEYCIMLLFRANLSKPKCGGSPGGGVLPYMGYIGMCRCAGYGFKAVYSGIGYINQRVWV